jgi:hypothetical protein
MSRKPTILSDISEDAGGPHWLSKQGRHNPNRQRDVHGKHRDAYLARKKGEVNANKSNEKKAKYLQQTILNAAKSSTYAKGSSLDLKVKSYT